MTQQNSYNVVLLFNAVTTSDVYDVISLYGGGGGGLLDFFLPRLRKISAGAHVPNHVLMNGGCVGAGEGAGVLFKLTVSLGDILIVIPHQRSTWTSHFFSEVQFYIASTWGERGT